MSAITGIFYRDGKSVDSKIIKKMNNQLIHRGLNGSNIWLEGPVAFGHQMLFTTLESLEEKLPYMDKGTDLVITADARIDNREELSKLLDLDNSENVPDSLFILKAYDKWGESCPEKLLGDFAFAIWDKDKEQLFCARDHMGVKPFYYYLDDDMFVFATEIKALFCVPGVPYKLNKLIVAFHFIPIANERILTFYEKILRLPAAHDIKINQSDSVIRTFWVLNPDLEIRMDSDEDYINKFKEIFDEAVTCRLRSAFPVGFELSGGLDSSSVVSVAKKNLKNKEYIDTFSLITNFAEGDEKYYIQKMINQGGIKPHFLFVDEISPLKDIEKIIWHSDKPIAAANAALFWSLYKIIHNNDIRVLLNGICGDSVLSHGQNYLKELTIKLELKRLIEEVKCVSKIRNVNPLNVFLYKVLVPMVPVSINNLINRNKWGEGDFILNNKEINKKLNIEENYKIFNNILHNFRSAKEFHYFLIVQSSHQNVLEFIDSTASAFFIENRYPFFDKRLIEFCYGIPTEQKFKFGWDRRILRSSMTNNLPEEIQWRPHKKFLTSVWEQNLLKYEKNYLDEIIYKKNEVLDTFFDPSNIIKIYERYRNKSNDYQITDLWDVWNFITLIKWLEMNKNFA